MRVSAGNSLNALNVLSASLQVTANNIANISTDNFKSGSARFETGPENQSVRLAEIRTDSTPGSMKEAPVFVEEDGMMVQRMGWVETSNMDLSREAVNLISTERAFEANTKVISSEDESFGKFLNEIA